MFLYKIPIRLLFLLLSQNNCLIQSQKRLQHDHHRFFSMSYYDHRKHGHGARRERAPSRRGHSPDEKKDDYYQSSVGSQTIRLGDSELPYITAGAPLLTHEALCREAAIIAEHENPDKNLCPTAGIGEQEGTPNYYHPVSLAPRSGTSRGTAADTRSRPYAAAPRSSSQRTRHPDSHKTRRDDYDRESAPTGHLVKQSWEDYRERDPEQGRSVRDSTSSRYPFDRLPSKDEQFGPGRDVYKPPPLPYEPGSQSGPPTIGGLREPIDID